MTELIVMSWDEKEEHFLVEDYSFLKHYASEDFAVIEMVFPEGKMTMWVRAIWDNTNQKTIYLTDYDPETRKWREVKE